MHAVTRSAYRPHVVNSLADTLFVEALFDRLPDVVFSVKDTTGRYLAVSGACVPRCRLRDKRDAVGRTAHELFPGHMADRYCAQDRQLFDAGRPVLDRLDLTVYNDRRPGWCLSQKQPVVDREGRLLGLICISKDLTELTREGLVDDGFARAVDHIQAHCARQLSLQELADVAGLSPAQLDRRMKRVFHSTTGEFVRRTRLEAALHAITHTRQPLAHVAADSGFCDQSALHRQCRRATGLSPRQLRLQAQQPLAPAPAASVQ
ncbi:AraC family transcriptional regulator [Ideonella sp. BN130291]|uniref:AraC family transcriptional regulator n=1 Tax=Ideonella sp. BN130291 TaxID=3112940 RepID=UPI002E276B97|nr:AraC family transcriptional regulator [Ideonella sp. BN130291]